MRLHIDLAGTYFVIALSRSQRSGTRLHSSYDPSPALEPSRADAGFAAAYMSTVGTHINLGASYLINDFYRRFVKRHAAERHYVSASRHSLRHAPCRTCDLPIARSHTNRDRFAPHRFATTLWSAESRQSARFRLVDDPRHVFHYPQLAAGDVPYPS